MYSVAIHKTDSPIVELEVKGKLNQEELKSIVAQLGKQIEEHGSINIFMGVDQFEGWTIGGLWEDLKFDIKHFHGVNKLAMVGDNDHLEGMAYFGKLFTNAQVKPFRRDETERAREWLAAADD